MFGKKKSFGGGVELLVVGLGNPMTMDEINSVIEGE